MYYCMYPVNVLTNDHFFIVFSFPFPLFFRLLCHCFPWFYSDGAGDSLFTFAVVVTALTLMGTATMFILISVFVLINNSCYSHERATVNGIGQTCAALGNPFSHLSSPSSHPHITPTTLTSPSKNLTLISPLPHPQKI